MYDHWLANRPGLQFRDAKANCHRIVIGWARRFADARNGDLMADATDQSHYSPDNRVLVELNDYRGAVERPPQITTFHRRELDLILRLYGRMVAEGEWRDYAIDHLAEKAVFSAFRRTSEVPLYRIEKIPKNARRQGAFAIVGAHGTILKRGHDLDVVLRFFDKKPKLIR